MTTKPDRHGNYIREEGCDRCACGCKYREHDRCVDCGGDTPVNRELVAFYTTELRAHYTAKLREGQNR